MPAGLPAAPERTGEAPRVWYPCPLVGSPFHGTSRERAGRGCGHGGGEIVVGSRRPGTDARCGEVPVVYPENMAHAGVPRSGRRGRRDPAVSRQRSPRGPGKSRLSRRGARRRRATIGSSSALIPVVESIVFTASLRRCHRAGSSPALVVRQPMTWPAVRTGRLDPRRHPHRPARRSERRSSWPRRPRSPPSSARHDIAAPSTPPVGGSRSTPAPGRRSPIDVFRDSVARAFRPRRPSAAPRCTPRSAAPRSIGLGERLPAGPSWSPPTRSAIAPCGGPRARSTSGSRNRTAREVTGIDATDTPR